MVVLVKQMVLLTTNFPQEVHLAVVANANVHLVDLAHGGGKGKSPLGRQRNVKIINN